VSKSLFWIRSFQWLSWSCSQKQSERFVYESSCRVQLTDSMIQLQQSMERDISEWLNFNIKMIFCLSHKAKFSEDFEHSTQYLGWFYDNIMILYWGFCLFWSLKASITIHCNCIEKYDYHIILNFFFCAPWK